MKQYEFDLSALTIGEWTAYTDAIANEDYHRAVLILDKFFVGGLINLPLTELANAMQQYNAAFTEWYAGKDVDNNNINRLLKQALGDDN